MTTLNTYGGGPFDGFPGLSLGRGDKNGHMSWANPVQALEEACAHLAARRKLPVPGLGGFVALSEDEARMFRFAFTREQYSARGVIRGFAQTVNDSDYLLVSVDVNGAGARSYQVTPRGVGGEVTIPFVLGDGDAGDYDSGAGVPNVSEVEVTVEPKNGSSTVTPGAVLYSLWLEPLPMDQIEV